MMDTGTGEGLPKFGHVNEVCKEWSVREDGALAYRLQSQEINEFYKGNKFRNAVVRQDFPTALNEQLKEKEMAEKQAAVYHMYLYEQEQADEEYAKQLLEKFERKTAANHAMDRKIAEQLHNLYLGPENSNIPSNPNRCEDLASTTFNPSNFERHDQENNVLFTPIEHPHHYVNKRGIKRDVSHLFANDSKNKLRSSEDRNDLFNRNYEFEEGIQSFNQNMDAMGMNQYKLSSIQEDLSNGHTGFNSKDNSRNYELEGENLPIYENLAPDNNGRKWQQSQKIQQEMYNDTSIIEDVNLKDLGLSSDEIKKIEIKLYQEKVDEELARRLQEEENKEPLSQEEKDHLLAIETQDKELAKMLQDRERAKVKKAKERARLKKQQIRKENEGAHSPEAVNTPGIIELDSYSNPVDIIAEQKSAAAKNCHDTKQDYFAKEDDIYVLPVSNTCAEMTRSEDFTSAISPNTKNTSNRSSILTTPIQTNEICQPPPYMPIQGTRRLSSSDGKKKKYKEKCTHQ